MKPGDHAVFQSDLYGGTHQFVTMELARFGIDLSFGRTLEELAGAILPNTRTIYVESPSNPLLRCVDLTAIAALGRSRKVLTIVDNTFATPINQNPLELGIDVVVHSATKYLNGHSGAFPGGFARGFREGSGRGVRQQPRDYRHYLTIGLAISIGLWLTTLVS